MAESPDSSAEKKLYLLDAFALIYRAYYAFIRNPLINSKGMNVSAITGFTNTVHDIIVKDKPTHLAVAFDLPGTKDFRTTEFEYYKANREATPEDISRSLPYIRRFLEGMRIPILELAGYEADDVIGTIATQQAKNGFEVYMVTPDKDYGQLVSENVFMYKPSYAGKPREILGVQEILDKWDIERVEQVIDVLGLMGDSVDNIPGVAGVGPKTASKLLKEYGSIEKIFENADKVKGKLGEKLQEGVQAGLDSKYLATIILDVPLEYNPEDFILEKPDKEPLTQLFQELEFRTIGKRILGEEYVVTGGSSGPGTQMDLFGKPINTPVKRSRSAAAAETSSPVEIVPTENAESIEHTYVLVNGEKEIKELVEELLKAKSVVFDTETSALDPLQAELVGLSFSVKKGKAWYVPCPQDRKAAEDLVNHFKPLFHSETIEKVGHNLKYDIKVLNQLNIEVKGPLYDTMVAHYLIEPDRRHKMDYLAENYLGYTPIPIENLIGKKGKNQKSMRDLPPEEIAEYAAEDADITLQLRDKFEPLVKEREVEHILRDIELPLIPVLAKMENTGVALDKSFLNEYSQELGEELVKLRSSIFKQAEVEFNLDSPKQLGQVLFDNMEIPYKGKKTKTGQYSTNEDTLSKLKNEHEIIKDILEYRGITKLKNTYVDALPALINPHTGRVHTTFAQTIAATGRLSSIGPNLQNIPIRTERGRKVREAFVATSDDHVIVAADYSQIELRLVAEISGDDIMCQAFHNGDDIHKLTAARVFNVDLEEVTREMRSHAKVVNFGIIYGVSAFGLSQQTKLSRTEAKEIIENYYTTYPGIKMYMDGQKEFAKEHEYVQTIMGRKRYLRDINSRNAVVRGHAERNAINAPIQGSAADLVKIAMINIYQEMQKREMKSLMTLQVHDELVFDALKSELDELKSIIIDKMETAIDTKVPMVAEVGIGENWLEAH